MEKTTFKNINHKNYVSIKSLILLIKLSESSHFNNIQIYIFGENFKCRNLKGKTILNFDYY